MNELELQDWRRTRLLAAIDRVSGGNKTTFAKRLGYRDGAFLRQMLSGDRSISEKTIRAIESWPEMNDWFTPSGRGAYTHTIGAGKTNSYTTVVSPAGEFSTGGGSSENVPGAISAGKLSNESDVVSVQGEIWHQSVPVSYTENQEPDELLTLEYDALVESLSKARLTGVLTPGMVRAIHGILKEFSGESEEVMDPGNFVEQRPAAGGRKSDKGKRDKRIATDPGRKRN